MKHHAKVYWVKKKEDLFTEGKYSRQHIWAFDGGLEVDASSSPHVVPVPMSNESAIDPEEAFVAAIASCHMLFFLSIAAEKNFIVERYEDHAEAIMGNNEGGKTMVKDIILKPRVTFSNVNPPALEEIEIIHQLSHGRCFLANSVRSEVQVITSKEPVL